MTVSICENPNRELPGSIFGDLVNLVWLDVRNNKLERLPSQIGESNSLRDILLGKNKNLRNNVLLCPGFNDQKSFFLIFASEKNHDFWKLNNIKLKIWLSEYCGTDPIFLFYSQGGNELRELPQQLVNIPSLTGKFTNKPTITSPIEGKI